MEHKTGKSEDFHKEVTLERLEDLSGYKVADGYDNVTGWKVMANGEAEIGTVKGLIASKELGRVLYLDIAVEKSLCNDGDSKLYILVPIGLAALNHDEELVNVEAIEAEAFVTYPRYEGKDVHLDYERMLFEYYGKHPDIHLDPIEDRTPKHYDHDLLYNQATVYGNRTAGF